MGLVAIIFSCLSLPVLVYIGDQYVSGEATLKECLEIVFDFVKIIASITISFLLLIVVIHLTLTNFNINIDFCEKEITKQKED